MDREAEALLDGENAARARHQAEVEMERGLVAQEQELERGTGSPIAEQADTGRPDDDGANVLVAGLGGGSASSAQGADGAGSGIVSAGAGTADDEAQSGAGADTEVHPTSDQETRRYEGAERAFDGDGRRPLDQQSSSPGE